MPANTMSNTPDIETGCPLPGHVASALAGTDNAVWPLTVTVFTAVRTQQTVPAHGSCLQRHTAMHSMQCTAMPPAGAAKFTGGTHERACLPACLPACTQCLGSRSSTCSASAHARLLVYNWLPQWRPCYTSACLPACLSGVPGSSKLLTHPDTTLPHSATSCTSLDFLTCVAKHAPGCYRLIARPPGTRAPFAAWYQTVCCH